MLIKSWVFSFVLFLCYVDNYAQPVATKVDVCVYGGTSAGVIAAYSAAKMGKTVLLIEPGQQLGGLSSGGLGYTDIGNKSAISGLALDFYRRVGRHYGKLEQWVFEPHVAEAIFNNYVQRGKVPVLYGYQIVSALKKKNQFIESIRLKAGERSSGKPARTISAKMFIDASYEGDLLAKAGVSYTIGRESNQQYGERINGVQVQQGHQFPDGIDPYKIKGDTGSGLLWGISPEPLAAPGSGDQKLQAYNYRICLTNDPANRRPIERPSHYDSSRYELLVRLFEAQPQKRSLHDYFIWSRMPNGKTDINNKGGFSTDMIGMNYRYPEASYEERKVIIRAHEDYTKGLLYFFGHDARVPDTLRQQIKAWGYPKDEYRKNDNWSPQLYVREARRMVGSYVMTEHNCRGDEVVDDGVGMAAYTMDSHNAQRVVIGGMVKNEGNVEEGGFGPYPVSYRALLPKPTECKNLLVPVCLSASHIGYGSIRMEPVFMVLAQSAAVAASMAIDQKIPVQEVPVKKLQQLLKDNPLLDGSIPDLLVDNDDSVTVERSGNWVRDAKAGGRYHHSLAYTSGLEPASFRFRPTIKKAGFYAVYYYYPSIKGVSSIIPITVKTGRKDYPVKIRTDQVKVVGQTSGEWTSLGRYYLTAGTDCAVEVSTQDANGLIPADAVLLIADE